MRTEPERVSFGEATAEKSAEVVCGDRGEGFVLASRDFDIELSEVVVPETPKAWLIKLWIEDGDREDDMITIIKGIFLEDAMGLL